MSDNVTLVQSAYAAFARGDIEGLVKLLDDSVQWVSPKTLPQGGNFVGPAGVGRFFEGVGAAWEQLDVTLDSIGEIADELVVAVVRASGSLRSGGPAQYGAAHVFGVSHGRIVSFREFVDIDKAITS